MDKNDKATFKNQWIPSGRPRESAYQRQDKRAVIGHKAPAPAAPQAEVVDNRWDATDDDSFELDDMV
ncbi:MAG: hypothetical protein IPG64_16490 [Haliea sp.]|nr:hypothetical protein [Haliea sp.]